jgi:hypothetical protein
VTEPAGLFDRVVEASGLMPVIAPYTISRLLISARLSPHELTRDELRGVLPDLEQGLAVYLDRDEVERALARLRRLADESPA